MTDEIGWQSDRPPETLHVFLVAVEESGDQLGAALMRALRQRTAGAVQFSGVGGRRMTAEGLASLHSTDDFSIMGFSAIPRRLPAILRHLFKTVSVVKAAKPHVLVVIDSPGYSLWVARLVRRANSAIKIIDYVSPSIWAWAPGRARSMRRYVDHVLALLPFEPEAHRRLGGPPCSYVGHPIVEQVVHLRPNAEEARRRAAEPPVLVVLPGSRSGEITRLAPIFGETIGRVRDRLGPFELVLPIAPHLVQQVKSATASWPVPPQIVTENAEKQAAFRVARAALAKSGTVTLELALAGVPMVAAYKVSAFDAWLARRLATVSSVILANLVIGKNVVPELIQEECTAERLAAALVPIIEDTPARKCQIDAFAQLDEIMQIGATDPAVRAADLVLAQLPPR
jgi:lipid-A-disaccharide synthase